MLKTQGALAAAIEGLKSAQADLDALTAQHAGQSDRAAQIKAEVREAGLNHQQAVASLKAVQEKYATGTATRDDLTHARREVDAAATAKTDLEDLSVTIQQKLNGRPAELTAASGRVAAAQRAFRTQLLEHVVLNEQPPGLASWLDRVVAVARVAESQATRDSVLKKILAAHAVAWLDCPTGDALMAASAKIEEEFFGESNGA